MSVESVFIDYCLCVDAVINFSNMIFCIVVLTFM